MKKKFYLGMAILATFLGGSITFNYQNIYAVTKTIDVKYRNNVGKMIDLNKKTEFSILEVANEFKDGMLVVKTENDKGKVFFGYINTNGDFAIQPKYEEATNFENGVASVKLNGKWGVIDKTGKQIVPFKYDEARFFNNGYLSCSLNGKWGMIDKTGKQIIPFQYEKLYEAQEGLINFKKDGKVGFINLQNKVVVPNIYDDAANFSEGMAGVLLNGKCGFIDKTGKQVIPLKYDNTNSFSEGKVAVQLNGKWGVIDKTGKQIVPFKYDEMGNFKEGRMWVGKNKLSVGLDDESLTNKFKDAFIYNIESEMLLSTKYKVGILEANEKLPVNIEDPSISEDILYGFIDEKGNEVIPCMYSSVWEFSNGVAPVGLNQQDLVGVAYIDKNGKILKTVYSMHYATKFSEGYSICQYVGVGMIQLVNISEVASNKSVDNSNISVNLDGKKLEFSQSPIVENGYTLVPMRNIFEALGVEISWDQATRTVTAKKDDKEMKITVDSKNAKVNGSEYQLDAPAKNVNGSVLVPLRFIGEQLGVEVKWDGATKTVSLISK